MSDVLGPFGLDKRNDKGRDLIGTYQSNNLSIMNTFFNISTFITHESLNEQKTKSMLDMIAASVGVKPRVINYQGVHDGIRSDHSAVRLKLAVYTREFFGRTISKGPIDRQNILEKKQGSAQR